MGCTESVTGANERTASRGDAVGDSDDACGRVDW